MASEDDASKARAETAFRGKQDRHEKGSAMTLIAEESRATEDKTARLRRMRLERDAVSVPEPVKAPRKTVKRAVRK